MALFGLLSPSPLPEKLELHEQKMLLPTFSSFRKAEKVEIFEFDSLPGKFTHGCKSKMLRVTVTGFSW